MSESKEIVLSLKAMGCSFNYKTYPQKFLTKEQTLKLFKEAHHEVTRLEDKLTDFRDSDFQKINQMAGRQAVKVDQETFDLIKKSIDFSKETGGIFDISFASIGHVWREKKERGQVLLAHEREKLRAYIDYQRIQLNQDRKEVFLPEEKMKISLGGIGKGYAVDVAYDYLVSRGLVNFMVNGSGDIKVHTDQSAPRPWRIGIRNPFSPNPQNSVGFIQVYSGAVASSGSYLNFIEKDDHHIINTQEGTSCNEIIASTILASNCLEADVYATVMISLKAHEALEFLNQKSLRGILIRSDGKSLLSKKALESFSS